MPDLTNPWDWLQLIFTALGLSTTAGLRAYLPLLAVALGSNDPSLTHIELSPGFQWMGTNWFIVLIGALALVEFGVDKVPGLDHINDLVHTIIRPASGAIIMAGIENPISHWNPWVAGVIGAVLALTMHVAKSATRPVVTATTVGVGNPLRERRGRYHGARYHAPGHLPADHQRHRAGARVAALRQAHQSRLTRALRLGSQTCHGGRTRRRP